jgi:hypothetical protein
VKNVVAFALCLACAPAFGQALEPGQWQFDSTMTSPALPTPQANTVQRCITKDDSQDPEKWMGRTVKDTDCKVTMKEKTATRAAWELDCPKSGMRGAGSARLGRGTVESEQSMSGELQGRKFEMLLKTTGKRLGPCKS